MTHVIGAPEPNEDTPCIRERDTIPAPPPDSSDVILADEMPGYESLPLDLITLEHHERCSSRRPGAQAEHCNCKPTTVLVQPALWPEGVVEDILK